MKRKRPSASTGHGTGVLQERSLRVRLEALRFRRRLQLGGSSVPRGLRDDRGRSVSRKSAAAHRRPSVDPFALVDFWKRVLVR